MHHRPRPPRAGWRLERPQGSAIIVALLAVALVAGMASIAITRVGAALDMAHGRQQHQQARQLARSAVELARLMLADDARNTRIDGRGEAWAQALHPELHRDARVTLQIEDMAGHFDVNALVAGSQTETDPSTQFIALLQLLGADAASAARAAASVQAHLRQYGPLAHVDAVRTIGGLDATTVAHLTRVAAALPAAARININTAPPAVLAATLPGLGREGAAKLANALRADAADTVAELALLLPDGVLMPDTRRFDVRSDYFLADISANHGVATVRLQALLARNDDRVDVVWLRLP